MKWRLWIACAGLAGVASIFLALAGLGTAASPNVCPSNNSCIHESVSPHFLTAVPSTDIGTPSAWPQAVSTTRFTNQSGPGGANASHTKISVTFTGTPIVASAPLVYLADIKTVRPDGTAVPSTCAQSATTGSVTVTCATGSTAGGQTVKLVVRFGAATNLQLDGDVTYGESGNDNPNGPNGTVNDNHSNSDFVFVGGMQQGSCFDLSGTSTVTVSGSDNATQATTATIGRTGIAGLPCTPAAAGILKAIKSGTGQNVPGSFTRDISFTDFLSIANDGTATVLVDFLTSLPKGFKLQELVNPLDPTNPLSWVEVKKCGDTTNQSPDSCIADTKNLPKGGFRYVLTAFGTFDDAKYSG